jgi:hypothetical protein
MGFNIPCHATIKPLRISMETYDNISELLIDLSPEELKKIGGKITVLLGKEDVPDVDMSIEKLYTSICTQISITTGAGALEFFVIRKNSRVVSKLKEIVTYLEDFTKEISDKPIFETNIYNIFAKLMVEEYKDKPLLYILNCYREFNKILNRAYPDYYESGLLHLVVK